MLLQGGFLVAAQMIVRIINVLYRVPVTNLWGDHGLGIYSDAYQVYSFFLVFASISIPTVISKMVSERLATGQEANAQKVFSCAMKFMSLVGTVCMIIMIAFGYQISIKLYDNPDAAKSIQLLGPTVLLCSVMSVLRGYFQGMNNMMPTAVSEVIEGLLHAVFAVVLAFVLFPRGLDWSVAGGIMGTFIAAVGSILVLSFYYISFRNATASKGKQKAASESSKTIYHQMIRLMIPIIISSTVFSFKSLIDSTMFGKLMIYQGSDPKEVVSLRGIYNGKFTVLLNLPVAIGEAMGSAAVPSIAASKAVNDTHTMNRQFTSMLSAVLLITVPCAFGLAVLGKPILKMLFSSFPMGGELFWIGSSAVVFYSVSYVAGGILNGLSKPEIAMIHSAEGVLLTEALTAVNILVFHMGIYSLALNAVIFSAYIMVMNLRSAMKQCSVKLRFWPLVRGPLWCSAFMSLVCVLSYLFAFAILGSNAWACIISILAGIVTYFFLAVNFHVITPQQLEDLPGSRFLKMFQWK